MPSSLGSGFIALCLSAMAASAVALTPNERLLRLVPPGSTVVAGFRAPTEEPSAKYYLLITRWNRVDFDDFRALTGADPTRKIHEAIFVSGSFDENEWGPHALLVQGTFDPPAVLRFADGVKVQRHSYRDIPVLVVQPFERERKYLKEVRWLALLDSHYAVFGTIDTVKQEIDRDLDGSSADPKLINRLSRLSTKDGAWSIVANARSVGVMSSSIQLLDPKLGGVVRYAESMQIGIQLGRRARLEYEYEVATDLLEPSKSATASSGATAGLSFLDSHGEAASMPRASTVRGVLKISRERYDEWIASVDRAILERDARLNTHEQ